MDESLLTGESAPVHRAVAVNLEQGDRPRPGGNDQPFVYSGSLILASYKAHGDGGEFAFAGELAEKRRQLAEVETALAKDIDGIHQSVEIAA